MNRRSRNRALSALAAVLLLLALSPTADAKIKALHLRLGHGVVLHGTTLEKPGGGANDFYHFRARAGRRIFVAIKYLRPRKRKMEVVATGSALDRCRNLSKCDGGSATLWRFGLSGTVGDAPFPFRREQRVHSESGRLPRSPSGVYEVAVFGGYFHYGAFDGAKVAYRLTVKLSR